MKRDFHAPGRSPVYGTRGMAATSMPIATLTAIDVLRAGGNALDAAIAACAVLGVVEPQSTGIGGDCFCLYVPANSGKVVAVNGSGRAPAAATPEALRGAGVEKLDPASPHVVTIPGAVSAWDALNRAYGRKPLEQLLRPAIRCAEEGWPVHARVHHDWTASVERLAGNEASRRRFLLDGAAPPVGHRFVQPELGKTLRAIARGGARAFYEGEIAADMVATLRALGGLHTEADFAEGLEGAEFVQPISTAWRGMEVFQCPPNGSGLLVLMLLGILGGLETPAGGPLSVARLHRHAEAARLVYRDRDALIADPAQYEVPVARLLSADYLAGLRGLIDDGQAMRELPPAGAAEWLPQHRDTVYLCVVDEEGNACSFINSLFQNFGSGILAEKSGVMLHNRGFGFRLQEGHPNCIAPRKRPMHTIMPGMVMKDGHALMPYGVMGGHFQPMGQTLFLTNHFEHGLDIQESLDLARLFPYGGRLEVERGIPAAVVDGLNRLGHECWLNPKPHGGGQAILIDRERGVLMGGSDPRKDGCAMGY
ncbi:gamma-glutamyltransferase family protein [Roseomonas sp. NAR14]|uniref:Gamma-glutamyltransferase family protein n=1 Tax=Roseomonas acroporae TaxID=2937791 RepID=A0A9X2BV59_9PROT|nr:gamma-glutamyltransferase family protein [Roseomonas acroporae]MCK8783674.1 gamma-glutamyltransferase family protein [Roseomonas acroporae]